MSNQTIDTLKKIDATRTLGLPLTASETAMLTFTAKMPKRTRRRSTIKTTSKAKTLLSRTRAKY